jgi:UDP-N-acetylglucosamine 2-epimerase (non-hydrolysing)
VIDHISQYLFVPTNESYKNLVDEGIAPRKIFLTGNTIVDAVEENLKNAQKFGSLSKFGLNRKDYILITLHRQENVDSKEKLKTLCKSFELINHNLSCKFVWPIHPRTEKMLKRYGISTSNAIKTIPPQGFFDFLLLEANAKLIITDSGGVQEEACILGVPCITVRDNTERPETIAIGSNTLVGSTPGKTLVYFAKKAILNKKNWKQPFGKNASQKIKDVIYEGDKNKK